MCGIAGLFDARGREPFDRPVLKAMADAIAHRGPDGEGFHMAPGIALAHRRLAVIDLAGGAQPMFSPGGDVAVVFNGEIYNFLDLTRELTALGQVFHTRSDTEVILRAWEAWGPDCAARFKGMFALALWDSRGETLFLARDHMGKKPLYYAIDRDHRLAFASELKGLLKCPWVKRRMSGQAVEEYLGFGYVPDPRTIYRDIQKLPPAHTLLWRRGEAPRISAYWDVDVTRRESLDMTAAAHELDARLGVAVQRRMAADVPLGAFLSGGVDSGGVVAHMARVSGKPVKTCTIGFDDAHHDERAQARDIADRYATDHSDHLLPSDELMAGAALIDTVGSLFDEPFGDMSAVPTYQVCAAARESVTVALSGDGGDEAFGGYRRYRWHTREQGVRGLMPQVLRGPVFSALARIYPKMDWAPRMLRAKTTFGELAEDAPGGYFATVAMMNDPLRLPLYAPRFLAELQGYRARAVLDGAMAAVPDDEPLLQAQYADLKTWLPGRMMVKVDRASMAHGLEVRSPLLDHDLFQWALALPPALKIADGEQKAVLKKALAPLVPEDVLRRKKQGFGMPLGGWLRGPLLPALRRAMVSEVMLDSGYFKAEALQALVADHAAGRRDHTQALWGLWMFERFLVRESGARDEARKPLERMAAGGSYVH